MGLELIKLVCFKIFLIEFLMKIFLEEKLEEYCKQILSKFVYVKNFIIGSIKEIIECRINESYFKVVFKVLNGKEMILKCIESI